MSGSRRSSFGSDRTYSSTNGRRNRTADFKEYKAAYISVLKNTNENISTRQQLTQVLQYAGKNPTVSQIAKIWSKSEGSISYEQICDILQDIKSTTRSQLISAFRKIDINGDGYISEAELYKVLTSKGEKMTNSEVRKILEAADSNKDGKLDYNEFCSMMLSTVNQCKQMNTQRLTTLSQDENQNNFVRSGPVPVRRTSRPPSIQGSVEEESLGFVSQVSVKSSTSTVPKRDKSLIQKLDDAVRVKGHALNELKPKSQQPRSVKGWTHVNSKGCLYVDEKNTITSHIYTLELPTASHIWLTMKPYRLSDNEEHRSSNIDVSIFILRENEKGENELVSFIESKDNKHWFWRGDLRSGSYTLIPSTSGCRLKPRGFDQDDGIQLTRKSSNGEVVLSKACKEVLNQVFDLTDLDGNGRLSREEFNFYQMMTSNEEVDDDAWQVVLDNFETEHEEMTREGFLKLHLLQAQEEDVDPQEELMESLKSVGFSTTLDLDQACPFLLDIFSKDCKASLTPTCLSTPEKEEMKNAIISGVTARDDTLVVGCVDGLTWYVLRTDFLVTTVLENKTLKMIEVQANCSQTKNCLTQKSKDNFTVKILPRSKTIVDHAVPAYNSEEWVYHCQLNHKPTTSKPSSRRQSNSSRRT